MKKKVLKAIAVVAGVSGITTIIYCLTNRVPRCLNYGCDGCDDDDEYEDQDIAEEYEQAMDTTIPGES